VAVVIQEAYRAFFNLFFFFASPHLALTHQHIAKNLGVRIYVYVRSRCVRHVSRSRKAQVLAGELDFVDRRLFGIEYLEVVGSKSSVSLISLTYLKRD